MTIHAENVRVIRNGTEILHGVSFDALSGERLTITGSNGAGKSTLIKSILGIVPLSDGSIAVDGESVGSRRWHGLRRALGYVGQHAIQTDFPISASEVVSIGCSGEHLPRRQRHTRMRRAMELTGCDHLWHAGYSRLSGGEKQRVSIARCLCQNPRALLLDEPTASLDPDGKENLLSLTEELSRELGITVLLVSHEAAHFARPGWRRLVLDRGRLIDSDSDHSGEGFRRVEGGRLP